MYYFFKIEIFFSHRIIVDKKRIEKIQITLLTYYVRRCMRFFFIRHTCMFGIISVNKNELLCIESHFYSKRVLLSLARSIILLLS